MARDTPLWESYALVRPLRLKQQISPYFGPRVHTRGLDGHRPYSTDMRWWPRQATWIHKTGHSVTTANDKAHSEVLEARTYIRADLGCLEHLRNALSFAVVTEWPVGVYPRRLPGSSPHVRIVRAMAIQPVCVCTWAKIRSKLHVVPLGF